MTIHLIIAEHDNKKIKKSTLSAISAAKKLDGRHLGVILGNNIQHIANKLSKHLETIYLLENKSLTHMLAQQYSKIIADLAKKIKAKYIWSAATVFGKDIMPRIAIKLNAAYASEIIKIVNYNTFQRPMFAGNIIGTIRLLTNIKVITTRNTEFQPNIPTISGIVKTIKVDPAITKMKFLSFDDVKNERPSLLDADIIVTGGRGIKGPEGFKSLIEPLANILKGAIGASRAVCDAGWAPNDWQIGQTGKIVAPNLYIAIGISGAIQHIAGMKSSKIIVAINNDPDAPIFKIANYGLVDDAFKVIPELIKALNSK